MRVSSAIVCVAFLANASAGAECVGDLSADGAVDGNDLGAFLAQWGTPGSADFNQDGVADGIDLGVLLANWGPCPVVTPAWATLVEAFPDPAVVTNITLRRAIVSTGLAWRVRDTATQIEMLLTPPGSFQMGCTSGSSQFGCQSNEFPVHPVALTQAFYLGRYEVTQAQWQTAIGANPSLFQGQPDSPLRPVDSVSWTMAQAFLQVSGMRLPTEAEWEFACRAGTTTAFHSGPGFPSGTSDDSLLPVIAWAGFASNGTMPVGQRAANSLGFHDMLGNVWEWVGDRYGPYPATLQVDPVGPAAGSNRVIRGGGWSGDLYLVRSSARNYDPPGLAFNNYGFRVARNP